MTDLNQAGQVLDKLNELRFVVLAPMRTAAFTAVSNEPENETNKELMDEPFYNRILANHLCLKASGGWWRTCNPCR